MLKLMQFLSNFNIFLLPEIALGNFRHARRRQGGCLAGDALRSIADTNSGMIFVSIDADSGAISKRLKREGIPTWGWGDYGHRIFFHVPREDSDRALAVLYAAGIDPQ